jgi:large subunit ribosomal protein L7e
MTEQMETVIPESVLQKQRRNKENAALKSTITRKARIDNVRRGKVAFKRAEFYVNKYKDREDEIKRLKQATTGREEFYVPDEPRLAFVIRIRGYVEKDR